MGDTQENVLQEVADYVQEAIADHLFSPLRDLARSNKTFKFTETPHPNKIYRFIVNLDV